MYKLRPINKSDDDTVVSNCMYRIKRISDRFHFDSDSSTSGQMQSDSASCITDDRIEELEKRWTNINARLQQLQADIVNFKQTPKAEIPEIMMPSPTAIQQLTDQQEAIVLRITDLVSSLSQLKSRLASMDDPQNICSTGGLEEQQRTLLQRIIELNHEIKNISAALNNNNNDNNRDKLESQACCHEKGGNVSFLPREFQDIVVRAHPSRPPYSLLLLLKQLQRNNVTVYASTHIHSNATSFDKINELKDFLPGDFYLQRSKAHMAITLIWSQGPSVEASLMLSPSCQSMPIEGEANIARYLSRVVAGLYYESADLNGTAQLDQLLDLTDAASPLGSSGAKKDRPAALQLIEKSLTASAYLNGGHDIGLVDAVLYSAIVNLPLDNVDKDVGPKTRAWMQRCRSAVAGSSQAEFDTLSPASSCEVAAVASSSVAIDRRGLEKYLDQLGITYRTLEHPAVHTVAAMMEYVTQLPGFYVKNLFVKDKKAGKLYLISARHDAAVSLSQAARAVGVKELRFADENVLYEALGVRQGSVTPLALLNDKDRHQVNFVVDSNLVGKDTDRLNFHPMSNDATTNLSVGDFKSFLTATGHKAIVIHL